jgi:hypothetical protein
VPPCDGKALNPLLNRKLIQIAWDIGPIGGASLGIRRQRAEQAGLQRLPEVLRRRMRRRLARRHAERNPQG